MFSNTYRRYVLAVLASVYMLSLLDRGLIMLLLEPIKADLQLTDTQLGFITGIAFALFYATLGIPLARWADRGNRATITALSIGIGSLAVMACIFVTSFIQLAIARMAAGIGEAGTKPPAYSLVGDYYPQPGERARAMAFYFSGNALASLVSFVLGGWLNEHYGWRVAFFVVAVPGLLMTVLVKLTVTEPRMLESQKKLPVATPPPLADVFAMIWRRRSLRHITLAMILLMTMGAGLGPWYAAFLIRSHGMGTSELGLWLGIIFSLAGLVGLSIGSYMSTRWFADNERGQMRMSALTIAAIVPFFAAFLLLPGKNQALLALIPFMVVFYCFIGPTYALMQRLVPDGMRATALAVLLLLTTLIGHGIGSQVVGILSDLLAPEFGRHSLRYAMLLMSLLALWSAASFWRVGDTVSADLRAIAGRVSPDSAPSLPTRQHARNVI